MKKFLLSCALALGIGANAQINYQTGFEDTDYSTTLYAQFGGGTRTAAAACTGTYGGQLAISSTYTQTGYMVILNQISGQTNNGQAMNVTASYKKASGAVGSLYLAYFVLDEATNSWSVTPFSSAVSLTSAAVTTCQTISGTVPAGALQPGKTVGVGTWFVRTSGTGNVYVDDYNFAQETVAAAPACTTIISPANGSTISGGNAVISWNSAATAVNYKVKIGTTSGGSEILNTTVTGTSMNVSLPTNSTIYVTVIPSNTVGDAVGCQEISFNTDANISYCGPLTTNQPAAVAPIKNVNFAGLDHASDAAVTTIGSYAPFEDFTATQFNITTGTTSLPITVTGVTNGNSANGWAMSVFIDWNNDGDFDDSGESYFNTTATMIRTAGTTANPVTLTGNIAIPADVTGSRRMRVKYNFSGTALHASLTSGCAQMGNGQAEDYTLVFAAPTAVPSCTTVTTPTAGQTGVAPNPATISWSAAAQATSYKLYIGTTAGGSEVLNGQVVNSTNYSVNLQPNTTYYVRVIATNALGDATGCTESTFTTGNLVYCAATATSTNTTYERISRVQFADIDNSSTNTAVGYEDFTSIVGNVTRGQSYPITVTIVNYDADQTAVWIDFNKNGIFEDSEKTVLAAAASATGTVVVPADAVLGQTKMRVRTNYNAAPPACGNTTFGQVEDYTINISDVTAGVSNVEKGKVVVYPNPFTDILKISDISGVKSISVSDVAGRQLKNLAPASEINLSSLKTGLYIVTLHMEDGSVKSVKAIKK